MFRRMPDGAGLYERDFYAWTREQAERLRALPPEARGNGLDVGNLAEEVEDLGRRDRDRAESFLELLVVHLLMLDCSRLPEPRAHWAREVRAFRRSLDRALRNSPSLRPHVARFLAEEWPKLVEAARDKAEAGGDATALERLDALRGAGEPSLDLEAEVLNPDWFPPYPR